VVGVESVLILTLAVGALYLYRQRREIQILVPIMVAFLFLQAALGAWAVMYPQASVILALHFGVSLIAFASVFLTAVLLFEIDGTRGADALRDRPVPQAFGRYVWALTAFTYVVVYSGALVRHINADDVCRGWPLCNGTVVPALQSKAGANLGHRGLALILTVAILVLFLWARRLREQRPDLYFAAHVAVALVVLQAVIGALVVWTHMDIFSALAHAATVGLLFATLTYVGVHVLPRPEPRSASVPLPTTARIGATPPNG
jgi:cytochrome c oxidase assembly protein subunit 15